MKLSESIYKKLTEAFQPDKLEIINESHQHEGHDGYGNESHLRIAISIDPFKEMNRIERQRAIFKTIAEEMKIVHALNIDFV